MITMAETDAREFWKHRPVPSKENLKDAIKRLRETVGYSDTGDQHYVDIRIVLDALNHANFFGLLQEVAVSGL